MLVWPRPLVKTIQSPQVTDLLLGFYRLTDWLTIAGNTNRLYAQWVFILPYHCLPRLAMMVLSSSVMEKYSSQFMPWRRSGSIVTLCILMQWPATEPPDSATQSVARKRGHSSGWFRYARLAQILSDVSLVYRCARGGVSSLPALAVHC